MSQTYLDFDLEIGQGDHSTYPVVVRWRTNTARAAIVFPFTDAELETHLLRVENAILRSAGRRRRAPSAEEMAVQTFGQQLFDFLLVDEARSLYYECLREAGHLGKGVRLKLNIQPAHLAALPWEFIYDPRRKDYVCLDANTPLVRYSELAQTAPPLAVTPSLRILGMIADPTDLTRLDVALEQQRVIEAVRPLQTRGLVELTWLAGQTWRELQAALRPAYGPWHIFHFIGHGGFDQGRDEGLLMLADEDGQARPLTATQLGRLLAGQRAALRLVLLNSCEGARGGRQDLLSSTAATLIQSGIPAVLAMQYEITNDAAVEFARTFYESLADNQPVDAAVAEARNAINLRDAYSLEWGTPVLHMRAPDGQLFAMDMRTAQRKGAEGQGREGGDGETRGTNAEEQRKADVQAAKLPAQVEAVPEKSAPRPPIDFDWVTIAAGEFLMGSDKKQDAQAFDNELPQHRLYVPEFRIALVPVKVAQYAQFVQATGYKTLAEEQGSAYVYTGLKWEDVKGAFWAHPRGPQSDVQQKANHPVTCIAWRDAVAFCAWAQVRLPAEAEWEKAARGTDGRLYPWGNSKPDQERCNFNMNVKDTTPVGHYPKGASPYGLLDLAGNMWEWTSTKWLADYNDYASKIDNNLGGNDHRVLRGGTFGSDAQNVRCAVRLRGYPLSWNNNLGFRVLVSPSPLASDALASVGSDLLIR